MRGDLTLAGARRWCVLLVMAVQAAAVSAGQCPARGGIELVRLEGARSGELRTSFGPGQILGASYYGKVNPASFQAYLNGEEVSDRFDLTAWPRDRLSLPLRQGENTLEISARLFAPYADVPPGCERPPLYLQRLTIHSGQSPLPPSVSVERFSSREALEALLAGQAEGGIRRAGRVNPHIAPVRSQIRLLRLPVSLQAYWASVTACHPPRLPVFGRP